MAYIKKSKLPDQTGNNGKYLKTDGTNTSWQTATGGGLSDGDYGDITVGGSGTTMTIDNLAVTDAKINDVAATKVTTDTTHRFVTDAQLTVIGNQSGTNTGDNATNTQYSGLATSKQDTLVSATNIKTINGSSVLGSGDLVVSGSGLAQYQVRQLIRR